MKFDTSFPILTKGTPPRCSSRRDILVSLPVTLDIPEVAVRDTEIAFETREVFSVAQNLGRYESQKHKHRFQLREYAGSLYRKISKIGELSQMRFSEAFLFHETHKAADPGADISVAGQVGSNPITSAIRRQHEWHLEKQSMRSSAVLAAWPQAAGLETREVTRSRTDFRVVAPTVPDIDEDLVEMSRRMIEVQAGRLLVIDDELWMASRPPSWRVQARSNQDHAGAWTSG